MEKRANINPMIDDNLAVEVDGQTESMWNAAVGGFADGNVYQTWAYGSVRWGRRQLSHLLLRANSEIVCAAQLRIVKLPLLRIGVAYLRWGPLCHRRETSLDPALVSSMLQALKREYVDRRGLALQVIPHAFTGTPCAGEFERAFAEVGMEPCVGTASYRTVLVDLSPETKEIRSRLDQKWRNQLNRSEKNILELGISTGDDAYEEFLALYDAMLARKQFESSVDVHEFRRIQKTLPPEQKMQIFTARERGVVIGAIICSQLGDTALYVLGATNERARELKASYFLQWQAMLWLRERGAVWYDLGGIDSAVNPGGYHFKSGFGGVEVTQATPHYLTGSHVGKAIIRGVAWLRRRRETSDSRVAGMS